MARMTRGRQEGWNSGIRNFRAQQKIDEKRRQRREKYRRKFGGRKARYRRGADW